MNTFVASIGSNSKDREWQMKSAIAWLKKEFSLVKISSIYNTEAINQVDDDYLNAVMIADCNENLEEMKVRLKKYETICGRTPASKSTGIIPMDLDIVLWNNEVIRRSDFSQSYFQKGWQELKEVEL